MNKYSAKVNWSDDDKGFIALVPEFPGLSVFAETQVQAVKEAMTVLPGYIEIYKQDGRALPEPIKI
ncbi:MAG: type II toxin-antitoxin system HicB family antitoxin [Deltaproteobacteria bacterium]|jgi:predicted RNase H-like HicB family nuclease|nr:type II toxin-antitoxin system HicB family antitoxin [Deltaproteobacteria bacterium]